MFSKDGVQIEEIDIEVGRGRKIMKYDVDELKGHMQKGYPWK